MSKNMYGLPNHIYLVLGGFKYTSDPNGLIANVLDEHAPALEFQRCMDEDAWLKLQARPPSLAAANFTVAPCGTFSTNFGGFRADFRGAENRTIPSPGRLNPL